MEDETQDDGLAAEVNYVLFDCLFKDHELQDGKPPADAIYAEGVVNKFGFHPGRIEANREKIVGFLAQMHPSFKEGWSFLNLCMTKDGVHWGEHRNCEALVCLGMAIGKVSYCAPRDMWPILPGGMPYVQITD